MDLTDLTDDKLDALRYKLMAERDDILEELHAVVAERNRREAIAFAETLTDAQKAAVIGLSSIESTARVNG